MSAATDDAADINGWLKLLLAEPLTLAQRLCVQNLATLALRRALEAEHFKTQLEARRGLTLVAGGAP